MKAQEIPTGYKRDAQGRLWQEGNIKPIDLARDTLVIELVEKAKAEREQLMKFKA